MIGTVGSVISARWGLLQISTRSGWLSRAACADCAVRKKYLNAARLVRYAGCVWTMITDAVRRYGVSMFGVAVAAFVVCCVIRAIN